MNSSTASYASFGYSEMFVAAPFDLDYDEPNAVVAEDEVEFVTTFDAIQSVQLPVCSAIELSELIEEATPVVAVKPAKYVEAAVVPAQRRTAA